MLFQVILQHMGIEHPPFTDIFYLLKPAVLIKYEGKSDEALVDHFKYVLNSPPSLFSGRRGSDLELVFIYRGHLRTIHHWHRTQPIDSITVLYNSVIHISINNLRRLTTDSHASIAVHLFKQTHVAKVEYCKNRVYEYSDFSKIFQTVSNRV